MNTGSNDPLHGIKLKDMLSDLVALFGFTKLHEMTEIRSLGVEFPYEKPVLKFLRKTPWARDKIEHIYKHNTRDIAAMKEKKAKELEKSKGKNKGKDSSKEKIEKKN